MKIDLKSLIQKRDTQTILDQKTKIGTIIRKEKLTEPEVSYLWQFDCYRKVLLQYQKLSKLLKTFVIRGHMSRDIYIGLLKYQELNDNELAEIITSKDDDYPTKYYDRKVLDCYFIQKERYIKLMGIDYLFAVKPFPFDENYDKFINQFAIITAYIITNEPSIRIEYLERLINEYNDNSVIHILSKALRKNFLADEVVDIILKKLHPDKFNKILKVAIHRENVSDLTAAKIFLL
jgi:hypothetical protein